jgi:diguanylate cyclase (GGDEF)-like protein/PAS domain S-box-containing protein
MNVEDRPDPDLALDAAHPAADTGAAQMDPGELDRICLFNLLSACADTIFFKDLDSRFIRVSQSEAELTGAGSPAAMLGKSDFDYFSPKHATEAYAYEQEIIRTGKTVVDLHEYNARPGDDRVLSSTKQPLRDFSGRIIGTFGITRDITARRSTERELLAKTEELDRIGRELRTLLETSPDPMVRVDRDLNYTYLNPAAKAMVGAASSALIGRTTRELGQSEQDVREWEAVLRRVLETGEGVDVERSMVLQGTRRFLHSRLVPEFDETGEPVSVLVYSRDLTDRKRIEDALARQAVHDPLTGLPNRLLLVERINQALAAMRGVEDRLAVLFLDLDRFKVVNDSLGHAAGDALLVAVAARLRAAARHTDVVARFGGDEFAVLSEHLTRREDAAALAERINRALAEPFAFAGQDIHVSASIGIAVTDDPGTSAEVLLRDADAAMYQSKERGRGVGGYQFFTNAVREQAVSRLAIETELRRALGRGEFHLVYEPVYNLRERRLVGAEALIRWRHPRRGPLAPADFIEVAEDSGLIIPIGQWVLREACDRLAQWNRLRGPDSAQLTVAVNLSVHQISDPGLVGDVADELRKHDFDPRQLCLEITETAVHDAPLSADGVLGGLSELGVRIALDDFGTGYSSLRHLRRVPVDILKVDRMFVSGLDQPGEDRAIVAAVIAMAHALGMITVGEGIETAEQYEQLLELGCDLGQGYLLSQPLPPEQFAQTYLSA